MAAMSAVWLIAVLAPAGTPASTAPSVDSVAAGPTAAQASPADSLDGQVGGLVNVPLSPKLSLDDHVDLGSAPLSQVPWLESLAGSLTGATTSLMSSHDGILNGIVGSLTGAPGTTAPSLRAVFNTVNLGSLLQSIACPIAKLIPSPPAPSQIASVLCALNILDYAYRTVYVEPNGTDVTRITRAIIGLPTPIDVNGDGIPDFMGTLTPALSGTALTLDISRINGFSPTAQVSVEAVALDPAAPQTYVGAGEDGLTAGTDSDWSASVGLISDTSAGTDISLTQNNSNPQPTEGTIGEIFSGPNPDAPTNTSLGDVDFTPAPASITANVSLGMAGQDVSLTSSAPTVVNGALSLISPSDDKEIAATINQLGKSVDVDYTQPSSGETKVSYSAATAAGQFSAQYHDTSDGELLTAAALNATGVPTGLTVDQLGSQTAVNTTGGPISLVEARYGSGRDVPATGAGTGAYASYHAYTDGTSTVAVRIPDLQALAVNAAEPFSGALTLSQPLGYIGLTAQDDNQGYVVVGHLTNLPQHSSVAIGFQTSQTPSTQASDTTGTVTFNGDNSGTPAGIGEIAVDITNSKQPFFDRADEINATIDSIPSGDTINFDYGDNGTAVPQTTQASATATQPIGTISVLAGDGSATADNAPSTDIGSGLWYSDTASAFYAFARINLLTSYNVSLTKDASGSISSLSGAIGTGSQDADSCQNTPPDGQTVTVDAQTEGGTFDGTIDQLPSLVSFSLGTDATGDTVVDYQASAPIQKITADATGFSSIASLGVGGDIAPTLDTVHAEIDCLPSHMTLTMQPGGETSLDTYGSHIGQVIAEVFNHQVGPATPVDVLYPDANNNLSPAPSGDQLAYYSPGVKGISIDLQNVGGFGFSDSSSGVLTLQYDLSSAMPLAFDYESGGPSGPELAGTVEQPQPGTLTVNSGTDGTISMQYATNGASSNLTGDGSLGTVTFDGNVGLNYLQGSIANVPANLAICVDYSTGVEDCGPPWVYPDSLQDQTDNPTQIFAIDVIPTDLNGNVPSTPLSLAGEFCFGSGLKSDCDRTGAGQSGGSAGGPAGVFFPQSNPLTFGALRLGFGQKTDNCTLSITCGRAWLGLDTTNDGVDPGGQLTGQARYYESNSKDPLVKFNTDTGGYLAATQYYLWMSYNVGASLGFTQVTNGSLACGASGQQGLLLNEGPGIDILTNALLGICP
ncbi:MAG TPA: hypothetical protein VGG38_12630 [Acidimicrobiales bacterium]